MGVFKSLEMEHMRERERERYEQRAKKFSGREREREREMTNVKYRGRPERESRLFVFWLRQVETGRTVLIDDWSYMYVCIFFFFSLFG